MGAIAKPIPNLALLPSPPLLLLLHEHSQLSTISDHPQQPIQHHRSGGARSGPISCRIPSDPSSSSSSSTSAGNLQAKNLVRAKARRSFAAQKPRGSARSAPLPARAISDLVSPPATDRGPDHSLSLEGLEALENLFLDSPSKIVDIDAIDPRSPSPPIGHGGSSASAPLVIFDAQDDDPKNVTMSIDREGPSHRRRHRRRRRTIDLGSGASTGSLGAATIGREDADDPDRVGSMKNAPSSAALRLATSGAKRKKKKKKKLEEKGAPTAGSLVRKRAKTLTKIRSRIEVESRVRKKKPEPNNGSIGSAVDVRGLVLEYGGSVNLMAHDWTKLDRQLLSVDEERCLASLMKPFKKLKKLREALKEQLGVEPSDKEWAQTCNLGVDALKTYKNIYEAARNKLIKLNLRLVKHQARKYLSETTGSNLSLSDLCQEGVKGLIVAVERFDPTKGFRLSTYAIFWIRNSILRAQTRAGHPIRIPFNIAELRMSLNKIKRELKMDGAKEQIDSEELMRRAGVTKERYSVVLRSHRRVGSLQRRDRVTGAELIQNLADPNDYAPISTRYLLAGASSTSSSTDPSLRLGIDDVLDSLKAKESFVLRQRFGLDGKGERSLGEIGRTMKISREMVRKYEARALLKLKHPVRLEYLRSFLSP